MILRMSSSTDSSTSMTHIAIEYDRVDGGSGKLIKKLPKNRKIVKKSEEPQRPKKFAKAIGLEESSFLTSDTRLAFTKMGFSHTKLMRKNYWAL